MTDEKILKRAIEKAKKNGWNCVVKENVFFIKEEVHKIIYGESLLGLPVPLKSVIYDHDFAKAFWNSISCFHSGKENRHIYEKNGFCKSGQTEWQYHLQQMVLEENPIKYLEKFI